MRRLNCVCGQTVYFDNNSCGNCGRQLAFDPGTLRMLASSDEHGAGLSTCKNRTTAVRCNWAAPSAGQPCLSCRTSKIIPALSKPANRLRWRKLERAKRRLVYDLLRLGLPVEPTQLKFVFKEDRRTNPEVGDEHVSIGHSDGVITINAAEADEVYRETMRQQMNEPYRTLLGHFRHESGHYYFGIVVGENLIGEARALFGDESTGYDAALQKYYRDGPPDGWPARFISSYATSHPAEDWAECWAHYLHILAVLEAAATGELKRDVVLDNWHREFVDLAIALNEVLRSMGLPDAYPFVITDAIATKIEFVHRAVSQFTGRPAGLSLAEG